MKRAFGRGLHVVIRAVLGLNGRTVFGKDEVTVWLQCCVCSVGTCPKLTHRG